MSDGNMTTKFAALGKSGPATPEQERRRALTGANKIARGRFYAAERGLDDAQRLCTQAVADLPPEDWGPALDAYALALAPYVAAASRLKPSPKE